MRRDGQKDEYYDPLLDNIDMAALVEDMDCEPGSQNVLQGIDAEDHTHEHEGTLVTLESPGIPGHNSTRTSASRVADVCMFVSTVYKC